MGARPRLARQPEPDRPRWTKPQRDRLEERQSRRRRSAARQQMDVRGYKPQSPPAERRRGGVESWRGGRPPVVAAGAGGSPEQWRAIGRPEGPPGGGRETPVG